MDVLRTAPRVPVCRTTVRPRVVTCKIVSPRIGRKFAVRIKRKAFRTRGHPRREMHYRLDVRGAIDPIALLKVTQALKSLRPGESWKYY